MLAGRYFLNGQPGWRPGIGLGWDEILGGRVALQQVGPAEVEPGYLAQAERTARPAARLTNRRMVRVLDVVLDDLTGTYWLVTEAAEGITLGDLVRARGRLIVQEAAALTHQAADALADAHAAGVVHGGVEPANILVGRLGRVKLAGFGIVQVPLDATTTDTSGLVSVSKDYLAPEVVAGQVRDSASDVWSLGATVLFALSGRSPYDIAGLRLGALDSTSDLRRLPEAGPLTQLLVATLHSDPGQRWPMDQVRDYLAESSAVVKRRLPVLLPRPSIWEARQALAAAPEEVVATPKRLPALVRHSHGVLAAMLVAIVAAAGALAMGATVIGFGNASDTPSASKRAPATSATPEIPLNTPYGTPTLRPQRSSRSAQAFVPAGSQAHAARRAAVATASSSPTSSPTSSPAAFESSSSSGRDSGSQSSGSHSKQPSPSHHHNPGPKSAPLPTPTPLPLPVPPPVVPTPDPPPIVPVPDPPTVPDPL